MSVDKLLKSASPLEKLFAGSSSVPILDFLMLAAEEGHMRILTPRSQDILKYRLRKPGQQFLIFKG
jgi:hypothetical protein